MLKFPDDSPLLPLKCNCSRPSLAVAVELLSVCGTFQVLVWHTRTEPANLKNEEKLKRRGFAGSNKFIEV